jgi:hypothetical protein
MFYFILIKKSSKIIKNDPQSRDPAIELSLKTMKGCLDKIVHDLELSSISREQDLEQYE